MFLIASPAISLILWIGVLIEDSTNRVLRGSYGKGVMNSDESMLGESRLHSPLVRRHLDPFAPALTMTSLPATLPAFSSQPSFSCTGNVLHFICCVPIYPSDCSRSDNPSSMHLACPCLIGTSFRVACGHPFWACLYLPEYCCICRRHGLEYTHLFYLPCLLELDFYSP